MIGVSIITIQLDGNLRSDLRAAKVHSGQFQSVLTSKKSSDSKKSEMQGKRFAHWSLFFTKQ